MIFFEFMWCIFLAFYGLYKSDYIVFFTAFFMMYCFCKWELK